MAALIAFGYVQRRVAEPLMPPRMFRDRNFIIAQALSFFGGAAMFTATNFLPQYTQYARGVSSTTGGLLLIPMMLGMVDMMVVAAILVTKTGKYRIYPILGGALVTVGMLLLLVLDAGTNTLVGSLLTAVIGLGVGCLVQNTVVITMNSVEIRDMGAGTGANTLARLIGGSLGVALLGSLFSNRLEDTLADRLGPGGTGKGGGASGDLTPELLRKLPQTVQDAFGDAVTNGLHVVAIGGAVVGVLTFAVAWFIREVPLRDTNETSAKDAGGPDAAPDTDTRTDTDTDTVTDADARAGSAPDTDSARA